MTNVELIDVLTAFPPDSEIALMRDDGEFVDIGRIDYIPMTEDSPPIVIMVRIDHV